MSKYYRILCYYELLLLLLFSLMWPCHNFLKSWPNTARNQRAGACGCHTCRSRTQGEERQVGSGLERTWKPSRFPGRVPLERLLCGTGHGWGDLRCPGPPPAQPHWSHSLWARQHADSREGTRVFLELLPNPFSGKMAPLVPQSVNWMWLFIHVPVVSQKCVIILWFDFLIYKGGKTKRRFVVGWWVMHMKGPEKPGDEIGSWHFSLLPFRLLEPFRKD